MTGSEVLVHGLTIAEGMRWHGGKLWFSDLLAFRVLNVTMAGEMNLLAEVPHRPSGLGFTPQGELLIVSMRDSRLMRLDQGRLVEAADLSGIVKAYCNDMVVDHLGRAYIGDVGFDRHAGQPPRNGAIFRVDPDGRIEMAADDIDFPNGAVISPDGRTMILAETFGRRLTAFDIDELGDLHNRRLFAAIDGTPDGIALDAEGAVWVADHLGHRVVRVQEGGRVTHVIDTGERHAFACALGGQDGKSLFYSTAVGNSHPEFQKSKKGTIEVVTVDVPAA